jgi:peptidoglycan hydrolase-like protein with peptidoglycan-binding domain
MTTWAQVWAAHQKNIGFVAGAGDKNPWTEELGMGDLPYCSAAASVVPHNQGVQWPGWVQVPPKGEAYSPDWQRFPSWQYDHASLGQPCNLLPGDIVTYDWNGDGVADHTETVVDVLADLTFITIGYNTGDPPGCHYPITRDRTFLVGRFRSQAIIYGGASTQPPPLPTRAPDGNPFTPLVVDGNFGPLTTKALQWKLKVVTDGEFGPVSKEALQRHLNVTPDGIIGPVTVRALQAHVGAAQDGIWGPLTTEALQGALNAGRF